MKMSQPVTYFILGAMVVVGLVHRFINSLTYFYAARRSVVSETGLSLLSMVVRS